MHQITTDYFNLEQILMSGQCFRMKKLSDGSFEVIAGARYLRACQEEDQLTLYCSDEELAFWRDYFDLDTDYRTYIDKINPNDTYLLRAAQAAEGVRILRQDLWETIVTFLVSQQNHIKRIRKCIDMLCTNYGDYISQGFYSFPRPEAFADLPEDALLGCNLGYRSKYVVRSAKQIVDREVCLDEIMQMPYRKAKEELLKLFGVGEKVADCICLFARHDLDAFPVDTHIRQALDNHYKRGFPNRRYKGFRGVMQQYIFCYELWGHKAAQVEKIQNKEGEIVHAME